MFHTSLNLLFLRNLGELWAAGRGKMPLPGDPWAGAEMDWLEPGGSTLSPKSLGGSWFFLPAWGWLSHRRSAMAVGKYFLGKLLGNQQSQPFWAQSSQAGPPQAQEGLWHPKWPQNLEPKAKSIQYFQMFISRCIWNSGLFFPKDFLSPQTSPQCLKYSRFTFSGGLRWRSPNFYLD